MIYKLNLPQLPECILDGVEEQYLLDKLDYYINSVLPFSFFKPEYLTLGGFNWTNVLIFYKKDSADSIAHTDNMNPNIMTNWGINWIYKGCGIMEYWYLEDFEKENVTITNFEFASAIYTCKPTTPPRLKYFLTPGAYLVNGSNAHRATGIDHRYCVSYRTDINTVSWSNIVNHFDNLVIGEAIKLK